MSAATKELLQFLSEEAPSLPIRVSASEYLLGLTGGDDGRKFIATIGSDLTNVLVNLLSSQSHPLNLNAIKSIVNLASDESSLDYLREGSLLRKLFDLITEHDCQNEHSVNVSENSVLALSNIAHWQTGAQAIVKFFQKSGNEMILYKVIERFFKDTDHLHHFASFLSNLSQVKEARLFILDKDKLVFQRITSFISFTKSKVRQKGVVATIKNCCFEEGDHKWLLSDEVDILPRLLLPLAGNEEFDEEDNNKLPLDLQYLGDDKERECDPGIRKMLIEAVFQLCATRECRKIIKDNNTYVIMRELYNWENNEEAKKASEMLISILIADEPEAGMDNLNKVEIPEDVKKSLDNSL